MGFSSRQVPRKSIETQHTQLMGSPLQERGIVGDFLNEASTQECKNQKAFL